MDCFLLLFPVSLLLVLLIFTRTSLPVSTVSIAALLLFISMWGSISFSGLVLTWIMFLPMAVVLNVPSIRRKLLSDQFYHIAQKIIPSMSSTEREALEAGSVWWDAELFSGSPDWNKLINFPATKLNPDEQAFIDGPLEELCNMLDDWQITDKFQDLPPEVWDFIKQKGFFGMIIPKEYGGLEFSAHAHSTVIMKLASRSISAAVTIMVPNSLGPAELLLNYGTDKQKDYYLPRLAKAEEIPCFALTGPEAGSDAASTPDTGVVCRGDYGNKKDLLGLRLNWEKRYITLAPLSSLLGLAFKIHDPDHLLGDKINIGITLALIPTNLPGISIGTRHYPLNSAFQVGPTWGKDVFIPMEQLIGGPAMAGKGWQMLMECLSMGRSISLPALSAGSAKLASRVIGAYARIRKQFKLPIGRFEGVEEMLALIAGNSYLIAAARTLTTTGVDLGEKPSVISAIAKYNLTELTRKVINAAVDVQGGAAICMGPRNLLARIYQSLPISITVEGSNILTRNLIVFGQGAIRCHPYLVTEMEAVHDSNKERGKNKFDQALWGHMGLVLSNAVRSFLLGLLGSIGPRITIFPGSKYTRPYFHHLTRMSAAFALVADASLLLLGGALKKKERLSARLADIFSNLYLASAALKRFEDQGRQEEDLPLLRWACEESLHNIQIGFDGILKNFPNSYISLVLRLLVFPLGQSFSKPNDRLDHKVADLILSAGPARDRLTNGIFLPKGDPKEDNEQLWKLEDALIKVIAAEPIEKTVREAVREGKLEAGISDKVMKEAVKLGILNEEEANLLRVAAEARTEVIRVDDFPQEK